MFHTQKFLFDNINMALGIQHVTLDDKLDAIKELENQLGVKAKIYHKEECFVLNYNQIASPKMHPIVQECRGLVLSLRDFSVISKSFNRFFNYGEADTQKFDMNGAVVFNKEDGSLVSLYFHPYIKSWVFKTRGTAFAESPVGEIPNYTFHDLIMKTIGYPDLDPLNKSKLDKNFTYVFEITSPDNKIVTPYNTNKLFYLTTIKNIDGSEGNYDQSYKYVVGFGLRAAMVKRFNLSNMQNIIEASKELAPTTEGYVVVNSKFERVKIKNPAYVALHHLRGEGVLTFKRIVDIINENEVDEFISYFPEHKDKINMVVDKLKDLFSQVQDVYATAKDIEIQKEFALAIKDYKFKGMLFALREGKDLKQYFNNLSADSKLNLLGVFDKEA